MRGDRYGAALVGAQFVSLAGLAWPGGRRWPLPRPVAAAAAALAVGGAWLTAAGAISLGRHASPWPAPPPDAPLRQDRVYRLMRHPTYAGLLAFATGVALLRARPEPAAAVAALPAVLHFKMNHEERLLRERFGAAYDDYAADVPRLLPRPLARRRRAGSRASVRPRATGDDHDVG